MNVTETLKQIRERLADPDGRVVVATHLRATVYKPQHRDWFSVSGSDLYVRQGRGRVCITYTAIKLARMTN